LPVFGFHAGEEGGGAGGGEGTREVTRKTDALQPVLPPIYVFYIVCWPPYSDALRPVSPFQSRRQSTFDLDDDFYFGHTRDYVIGGAGKWDADGGGASGDEFKLDASPYGGGDRNPYALGKYYVRALPTLILFFFCDRTPTDGLPMCAATCCRLGRLPGRIIPQAGSRGGKEAGGGRSEGARARTRESESEGEADRLNAAMRPQGSDAGTLHRSGTGTILGASLKRRLPGSPLLAH